MTNEAERWNTMKQDFVDRRQIRREQPAHPALKANLLMAAVVVLLLMLAVLSTVGAR